MLVTFKTKIILLLILAIIMWKVSKPDILISPWNKIVQFLIYALYYRATGWLQHNSGEFFLGFYMANNESNVCTLYVHTMNKSPVTFNVISLNDNFSYIYGYN